jgi:hypothetical protein
MKIHEEVEVQLRHQMEMGGQLHTSVVYPGERVPGTHWIRGWVGPMYSLDALEQKSLAPVGNRTPAVQRVAIPNKLSRLLLKEKVHRNNITLH